MVLFACFAILSAPDFVDHIQGIAVGLNLAVRPGILGSFRQTLLFYGENTMGYECFGQSEADCF